LKLIKSILRVFFIIILLFNQARSNAQRVSHIKITTANALQYRDTLIKRIFGPIGFPYTIMPDSIVTNVSEIDYLNGFPYTGILYPSGNLDSIDKMVVTIDTNSNNFPTKAKLYLFHPHNSNGKLFVYHAGHCAGTAIAEDVYNNEGSNGNGVAIPTLLAQGYTVLAVPMLHYQMFPRLGYSCGSNRHDPLFSDGYYSYPLALFFRPLIAGLNQLGRENYAAIYMMGLSGGGWTTSVYPAVDSSISMSFPIAGSWPIAVRNYYYSDGDGEQYYAPVFRNLLDYHDLYTLSCLAPPRKMLQINNRYDPCCFNGSFQHLFYVDSVVNALAGTGGEFSYYLDETGNRHAVTEKAMQVILKYIDLDRAQLINLPDDSITAGMPYYYNISSNFTTQQFSNQLSLSYSLLKAPDWITLNNNTGEISGQISPVSIVAKKDTISFKVEDSLGRFVICNLILIKKRSTPYLFTKYTDSQTVYLLPFYPYSMQNINQLSKAYFYFNNPALNITELSILNNSIIKLKLNMPLTINDSIGYNGINDSYPITYFNGMKLDNFELMPVAFDVVKNDYAIIGMIRFNTDTKKFEYFNGVTWINMN